VNYAKWDNLVVDEDDSDEDRGREAAARPSRPPLPVANEEAHAFIALQLPRVVPEATSDERVAFLHFLRIQDPGADAKTNITACNEIADVLVRSPELATLRTLDRAALLTRDLCFRETAEDAPSRVPPILLSAVNTLAACVEVGAIKLYAQISTPKSPEAVAMRARYEDQGFGKDYMLSFMGFDAVLGADCDGDEARAEGGGWLGWCTLQ